MQVSLEEIELLTIFRKLDKQGQTALLRIGKSCAESEQERASNIYKAAAEVGLNARPIKVPEDHATGIPSISKGE